MARSRLDIFIEILREVESPKRRSSIAVGFNHNARGTVEKYSALLASNGYLIPSGDSSNPAYRSTERAILAIGAYDRLALKLGFTYEEGIRASDLAVLREFGNDNYKAKLSRKTAGRAGRRLLGGGFVKGCQLTERGRTMLEQGRDLFGLADLALSL